MSAHRFPQVDADEGEDADEDEGAGRVDAHPTPAKNPPARKPQRATHFPTTETIDDILYIDPHCLTRVARMASELVTQTVPAPG